MAKKLARYRRMRVDRYGHPKTGGMPLQVYALADYAVAQNLLGVLQQSPRAIAARFGNSVEEVEAAIAMLCTAREGHAPIAVWWPELETLWIVEALDEQSDGGMADTAARKHLATLPAKVQSAILERYDLRMSDTPCDTPSHGVGATPSSPGNRKQGTGNREQEYPLTPASGGRSRRTKPLTSDARIEQVLAAIDAERARRDPPLPPLTPTQRSATTIASALGRGATVERLLDVVGAFGRLADRDPSKASVLNATTPFTGPSSTRPGGLAWGEALLDEERTGKLPRPSVPAGGRVGRDVDDVIADRKVSA